MRGSTAFLIIALSLAGCAAPAEPVDSDGDGFTDDAERAAGSDPLNATSVPEAPVDATPANATIYPVWGELASAVIRPGADIMGCTSNWLFEGPNGTGYMGTAAHCTTAGERISVAGVGEVGTVVYDSDDVGSIVDFSLIRLDDDRILQAHPQIIDFDGPTGYLEADELAVGDIVSIHGYGMVFGQAEATQPRSGVLTDWTDDEYVINMPAVYGDSGSAIIHESGKALGIISRFGWFESPPSTDRGPLMPFIFQELEKAGYGDVRLATI